MVLLNKKLLLFVFYCSLLFSLTLFISYFRTRRVNVYAEESWNDNFYCYKGVTYHRENIRNWTNVLDGYFQDVVLALDYVGNSSYIDFLLIYGNNTIFIQVINGTVTKANCTYYNLAYSRSLFFDLQVKPNDASEGKMLRIRVQMTVYKVIIGDINRDDIVNIYDGIELGNSWHDTVTDENRKKDLNFDGVINIYDGILLGTHYGDTL